jgi:hypothetical protein
MAVIFAQCRIVPFIIGILFTQQPIASQLSTLLLCKLRQLQLHACETSNNNFMFVPGKTFSYIPPPPFFVSVNAKCSGQISVTLKILTFHIICIMGAGWRPVVRMPVAVRNISFLIFFSKNKNEQNSSGAYPPPVQ